MASVWGELKRRNVVKVAVAYAIVGWLLIEVSSTVLPLFEAPDWIAQVFAFFVILGFPLALILSWAYEITPEGIKLERDVAAGESITHVTGRKLDFAIIGALVLALGFVVYNYVLEDGAEESPEVAVVEPEQAILPNSVAVLPFENLSLDPEDAFFAAGIHEELLNQLAKLSELNVIARTSMMLYADGGKSIPEIAEELNVETVMEGSVRYADGRVLVTAQLIDPETNAHLWSDSYNREFSDVFAIQADIAMNIANALEAEFSLAEQDNIEKIPTDSAEAYEFYLTATQVAGTLALALAYLDQAIDADPNFAVARTSRAFARLIQLIRNLGTEENYATRRAELEALAFEDIEEALASDPTLGNAYATLAAIHQYGWRGKDALEAFERANQLSPNDPSVLLFYGNFLTDVDRHDEAIQLLQRALALDPNNEASYTRLGRALLSAGEHQAAITVYREAINLNPNRVTSHRRLALAMILVEDNTGAARQLRFAETLDGDSTTVAYLFSRIGLQEDATRVLNRFEELAVGRHKAAASRVLVNLARGDEEQSNEWLSRAAETKEPYESNTILHLLRRNNFRDTILDQPRFVEVRERLGFTDL